MMNEIDQQALWAIVINHSRSKVRGHDTRLYLHVRITAHFAKTVISQMPRDQRHYRYDTIALIAFAIVRNQRIAKRNSLL